MKTFEEKLEESCIIFSITLKKFDDETSSPMFGVFSRQINLADELKKEDMNMKIAS